MKSIAKLYDYSLTTLSPLHIGAGEMMTPLEYHVSDALIVPELPSLFAKYPDAAEQFTEQLAAKSARDLARIEMGELVDPEVLADGEIRRYAVAPLHNDTRDFDSLNALADEVRNGRAEVWLATKTVDHRPYIPGSSIKGALKTAWAYEQCRNTPSIFDAVSGLAWQGYDRATDQRLISRVFHAPPRRDQDRRGARDRDESLDLFHTLQIGDSESLIPDEVLLLVAERLLSAQIKARADASPVNDRFRARFHGPWIFCEAIDENFSFNGRLSFDDRLLTAEPAKRVLGWSPTQSELTPEKVLRAVNNFAADLCQWEIEYFERLDYDPDYCDVTDALSFYDELSVKIKDAPPDTCYFSLGYGSGWHKLTIGLLLEKRIRREEFSEIRRGLNLAKDRLEFEYPKSRRLVMNGAASAYSPFGWVRLKLTAR
ncbi:MAG TPA: type III-A CRISPR-associated RAMP protein Csm5 [Blastocatellia bacterium]|nr:type III-A CRISPR-associated RAMP protein Csm5 [Blastocatellia bacterium]